MREGLLGWATDTLVKLDDDVPGVIARVLTAAPARRQAIFAALAVHEVNGGGYPEGDLIPETLAEVSRPTPFPLLAVAELVVHQDARLGVRQVRDDGFDRNKLGHKNRLGLKPISFHWRIDEEPFRCAEPPMAPSDVIEVRFKLDAVDLAVRILKDANGKAAQRLVTQANSVML